MIQYELSVPSWIRERKTYHTEYSQDILPGIQTAAWKSKDEFVVISPAFYRIVFGRPPR